MYPIPEFSNSGYTLAHDCVEILHCEQQEWRKVLKNKTGVRSQLQLLPDLSMNCCFIRSVKPRLPLIAKGESKSLKRLYYLLQIIENVCRHEWINIQTSCRPIQFSSSFNVILFTAVFWLIQNLLSLWLQNSLINLP